MCFHSFDILAKALAAVRDLKKICLTKNLRFVKKVSALRKAHLLPKYIKFAKSLVSGIYIQHSRRFVVYLRVF